ncbi:MAG: aldehyde dehydrogenase family protein, partial [Pseudomonadota bacterium]
MADVHHFIDGERREGNSGRFADIFDPNTGQVQRRAVLATTGEVNAAVEAAVAASAGWAATNPQKRARVMFNFKRLVEENIDELAEMLSSEHGKVIADSKGDVQRGLDVVEFACGIPHLLKGEYTEGAGPGIDVFSMRQPLGVCAGITPFNFPAMIPCWMFSVAIACGNTFVLKPSEKDPSVPMRLCELMMEAGAPAGVLNMVNGDKEAVDAILTHPDIKAVSFVGSSDIAHYVYSTGTNHGKRVQAMGGAKNHGIILPDADMDQVVKD